jgi:hypothetical protein
MASLSMEKLRELISPESITKGTTLDRVLDDLFNEKIEFKVREDFIRCLQITVENFVRDLLNALMKLEKVQTKIQTLKDTYKDIPNLFTYKHEVLGVGSFYEGTKITFPDEFDFVLILLTAERLINIKQRHRLGVKNMWETIHISDNILRVISDVIASRIKDLSDYAIKVRENQLFDFEYTSVERVGPACKLCFTLSKKVPGIFENEIVNIYVDVTPAIRVKDKYLPLYVDTICSIKDFSGEILKIGSFIVVEKYSTRLSFTETELSFMKNCLSARHRKAYRILKYLVNVDVKGETILPKHVYGRDFYRPVFKLSSYLIKILMIQHHFRCKKNENIWRESACILDIFKDLLGYVIDVDRVKIPTLRPNEYLTICSEQQLVHRFANEHLLQVFAIKLQSFHYLKQFIALHVTWKKKIMRNRKEL